MWPHPDASERSIMTQFPEIFNKHDLHYFDLPNGRMLNFFKSSQYLDASRKTKDIGKIFSAVQCAMQEEKYMSLQGFLKSREIKNKLANTAINDVGTVLNELFEEYNDKYGMARQVRSFYKEYLDEDSRKVLFGKLPRPASYKPGQYEDSDGQLRVRVDFLLELRNGDAHAATYLPLPDLSRTPLHYERVKGDPSTTWLIFLTFDDLYEISRKAMSQLWLEEYEIYWSNGGKEIIGRVVAEVQGRTDELNATLPTVE